MRPRPRCSCRPPRCPACGRTKILIRLRYSEIVPMPESRHRSFYIDGAWRAPLSSALADVVDPATEVPFAQIAVGNAADVDRAVAAARKAFPAYAATTREERIALLCRILEGFNARREDLSQALSREMGVQV